MIVWADEATAFHGELSARGGDAGGDGGFAEISGASSLGRRRGRPGRGSGANGTLLYDPKDIVIDGRHRRRRRRPRQRPGQVVGPSLGQILFDDPDELITPFEDLRIGARGHRREHRAPGHQQHHARPGTFDGAVRITDGFSLAMRTRNDAGDDDRHRDRPGHRPLGRLVRDRRRRLDHARDGHWHRTGPRADIAVGNLTTAGGAVRAITEDGAIAVGDVATAGAAGSAGGAISLLAGDANRSGTSDVTAGVLDSSGGVGAAGAGGSGGAVTVRSTGAVVDDPGCDHRPDARRRLDHGGAGRRVGRRRRDDRWRRRRGPDHHHRRRDHGDRDDRHLGRIGRDRRQRGPDFDRHARRERRRAQRRDGRQIWSRRAGTAPRVRADEAERSP